MAPTDDGSPAESTTKVLNASSTGSGEFEDKVLLAESRESSPSPQDPAESSEGEHQDQQGDETRDAGSPDRAVPVATGAPSLPCCSGFDTSATASRLRSECLQRRLTLSRPGRGAVLGEAGRVQDFSGDLAGFRKRAVSNGHLYSCLISDLSIGAALTHQASLSVQPLFSMATRPSCRD